VDDAFLDPDVLGVYEAGVPPLLRVLLSLGCVARVDARARSRLLERMTSAPASHGGGAASHSAAWALPKGGRARAARAPV